MARTDYPHPAMPLRRLGFLEHFVPIVLDGTKRATIRKRNLRTPAVGDRLMLTCKGQPFAQAEVVDVSPFVPSEADRWAAVEGFESGDALLASVQRLYRDEAQLVVITFDNVHPWP